MGVFTFARQRPLKANQSTNMKFGEALAFLSQLAICCFRPSSASSSSSSSFSAFVADFANHLESRFVTVVADGRKCTDSADVQERGIAKSDLKQSIIFSFILPNHLLCQSGFLETCSNLANCSIQRTLCRPLRATCRQDEWSV